MLNLGKGEKMNTLQLEYLLEVERTGSISQAAQNLYMNQPNLSKSIKELEESLGILIFHRTPQGVTVTKKGKEFLEQARFIVEQVDQLKEFCKDDTENALSVAVPQSSYISVAFYNAMTKLAAEIEDFSTDYRELPADEVIRVVEERENKLGIVRYSSVEEKKIQARLAKSFLKTQLVFEFQCKITVAENSPLAGKKKITSQELCGYTEIVSGENLVLCGENCPGQKAVNRLQIVDRSMQYMLLQNMPKAYICSSPIPREVQKQEKIVQIEFVGTNPPCRDLLIYNEDDQLTAADQMFLDEIQKIIDTLKTA